MPKVELTLPVSREDIENNADDLLPSDLEGDQREAAINQMLSSARAYESFVETRDPVEQIRLRSQPIITSADEESSSDSESGNGGNRRRSRR